MFQRFTSQYGCCRVISSLHPGFRSLLVAIAAGLGSLGCIHHHLFCNQHSFRSFLSHQFPELLAVSELSSSWSSDDFEVCEHATQIVTDTQEVGPHADGCTLARRRRNLVQLPEHPMLVMARERHTGFFQTADIRNRRLAQLPRLVQNSLLCLYGFIAKRNTQRDAEQPDAPFQQLLVDLYTQTPMCPERI